MSQGFLSSRRYSKITPKSDLPGKSLNNTPYSGLFLGGKLMLTIVQAEKYFGTGRVFGRGGKQKSYVQVFCGERQIAKSVIEDGMVAIANDRWTWAGYDSSFRVMEILPCLASSIRLVIFDCDRDDKKTPLGIVNMPMQHVIGSSDTDCNCIFPIEFYNSWGFPTAQGSVTMNITFSPYSGANISRFGEQSVNMTKMKQFVSFGVGWDFQENDITSTYDYGASLVMFNEHGAFVDAVDARKKRSRKGPPTEYDKVMKHAGFTNDREQFTVNLSHPAQQKIFAYFIVVTARSEEASLQNLDNVYVRMLDGKSKKEEIRYNVEIPKDSSTTACVAARITKDPNNSKKKWNFRASGEMDAEGRNPGFLIPIMKNLLSDLIPGLTGSCDDRIMNLGEGEAIAIESLCSTFVSNLSLGLKWEAYGGKSIDLDASCLMLDANLQVVDSVHFEHLQSNCGSILHGGDTTDDKKGDEDDEQIHMTFALIPEDIVFVVFVVSSYSGVPLSEVSMCSAHFFETESKRDLVLFEIGGDGEDNKFGSHTAVILCIVFRYESKWYFLNASECSDGKLLMDNLDSIKAYIINKRVCERQREQNERLAKSNASK